MGVKQKPTQSTPANGLNQPSEKDREREKRRRAAETNVGKEFQTVREKEREKNEKELAMSNIIFSLTLIQWIFLYFVNMLEFIKSKSKAKEIKKSWQLLFLVILPIRP